MKKSFTITEVLLAVAIIGVAAALVLPALIEGTRDNKIKTNFKKAVKIVNDAISINIAKGEKSAYYTDKDMPLYFYLQKNIEAQGADSSMLRAPKNSGFYTMDNMRFEFPNEKTASAEFNNIILPDGTKLETYKGFNCGTKGMDIGGSAEAQEALPCVMLIDANGDDGPNELTTDTEFNDMFILLVTDEAAFPYGEMAKRIYEGEK